MHVVIARACTKQQTALQPLGEVNRRRDLVRRRVSPAEPAQSTGPQHDVVGVINRVRTVPENVPGTRQNRASRANRSQIARSRKLLKGLDLLGKSKMSERRISV